MEEKNAREVVVDILLEIDRDGAYANIALRKALDDYKGSVQDKGFITEITNGTIKYRRRIDYVISQFSKTPNKKMKPLIRNVLRMSVYQIMFLDKVPVSAACNEAVKIVKKRRMAGLSGFVNGVLRNIARGYETIVYPDPKKDPVEYLGVMYSFPNWMIEYWLEYYSFDFVESLCESLNRAPEVSIRTNRLKISKENLKKTLAEEGLVAEDGLLVEGALKLQGVSAIDQLRSFKLGYFTVQDESSMLVSQILDPQKGERILDVCAAPGGKTTHIAQIMCNEGTVISADIHDHKLELINDSKRRLGHSIVQTVLQDATKENPEFIESFDRVLIDAPCSGLGILHKKSDIRWNKEYKDIESLVQLQKKIIKNSSQYVKPGGVMVYSTCTISPLENKEVVDWVLENLDFELEKTKEIFPSDANTDGFFIARLRKRGNNEEK